MPTYTQEEIIRIVKEEAERIAYGKLLIEITVHKGIATNMQTETKRSNNLNK